MRTLLIVSILTALLSTGSSAFVAEQSPALVVRGFYKRHFVSPKRMFFSRANVRRESGSLSPKLYRLMLHELRWAEEIERKYKGTVAKKPYISGDVFTNSDSPPQVFRLGKSSQRRGTAEVEVWCYWNDQTVGRMKRPVRVRLVLFKASG